MLSYRNFRAAIFDVDDTLLDNRHEDPRLALHERSRHAAVQAVGKRRNIAALANLTLDQNRDGWDNSPEHTLEGALWTILLETGVVQEAIIDHSHPLLKEMAELKEELHEEILRKFGQEVPGATAFVRQLAANGFKGKLAIASTANPRDIYIFLDKTGLRELFPDAHIISKHHTTKSKPHPEAFNLAFAALGLPESARAKTLAFEDHVRGVASAKAAGLFTCAITTNFSREQLLALDTPPDLIADSFAEFAELLGLPK